MEMFNENRIDYPTLPAEATKDERLALEITCRLIDHMNRTDPNDGNRVAFLTLIPHGNLKQMTLKRVYLAEYGNDPYMSCCWKSGSKVAEAVLEILSSRKGKRAQLQVNVELNGLCIGKFTHDLVTP